MLQERQKVTETINYLQEKGCHIVRTEVESPSNKRKRADLVGYIGMEGNDLLPKVVAEIRPMLKPETIQQVFSIAQDFDVPYVLIVTLEGKQWFSAKTLLPITEPAFESESEYTFTIQPEMISQVFKKCVHLFSQYGYMVHEVPNFLASALLIRSYLYDRKQILKWRAIRDITEYQDLFYEACIRYNIEYLNDINIKGLSQALKELIVLMDELPVQHTQLKNEFFSVITSASGKSQGYYIPSVAISNLFKGITKSLQIKDGKSIDLNVGYGALLHEVAEVINARTIQGIERNQAISTVAKMISVFGERPWVEIITSDPLWFERTSSENIYSSYSLAFAIPPFGLSIEKSAANYDLEKFRVAVGRRKVDMAELLLEQAIYMVQPGGHILYLVPEGMLFSLPSRITRDLIKEETIIEGVISLPAHSLKPYTGIKTSLLILRKKQDRNETASELFMSRPESVEDFEETIRDFSNWKKGEKSFE
ncbi:N-6 DNA methylase [Neobacillus mesonae]|uniref:N-6 DNA methylase n=1 Tax=Neobacillus mesonae TaxID=1193713 RepID=UPI002574741C|nr:N-6 DNA methylase [Neobacillus mesonae]